MKKAKLPMPSTSRTEPDSLEFRIMLTTATRVTTTLRSNSNAHTEVSSAFDKRDPCFGLDSTLENIEEGPYQAVIDFPATTPGNKTRKFRQVWYGSVMSINGLNTVSMMTKLSTFIVKHLAMGQTGKQHFELLVLKHGRKQMKDFANIQSVNPI